MKIFKFNTSETDNREVEERGDITGTVDGQAIELPSSWYFFAVTNIW